jgi:hypothetical protein
MTNLNRTLQDQIKALKIKNTESIPIEKHNGEINNNSQEQS